MQSPVRIAALALVLLLSLPLLGLSAHIIALTVGTEVYFIFAALGVAAAVLTLVFVGLLLVQSVAVWLELGVFGVLWTLWVATAAEAGFTDMVLGAANCALVLPEFQPVCEEFVAVQGLSAVVSILMAFYMIYVVVDTVRASSAGRQDAWTARAGDRAATQRNAPLSKV